MNPKKLIKNSGWLFLRLAILNASIFVISLLLGFVQGKLELQNTFEIKFPVLLFTATVFLANLIYLVGLSLEAVYLKLWEKNWDFRSFEPKFFKASWIITLIAMITGILLYSIK